MNPNLNPKPISQCQSLKTRPEHNPSCNRKALKKKKTQPRINFVRVIKIQNRNKLTHTRPSTHKVFSPLVSHQSSEFHGSPSFSLFSTLLQFMHCTPCVYLSYRLSIHTSYFYACVASLVKHRNVYYSYLVVISFSCVIRSFVIQLWQNCNFFLPVKVI